MSLKQMPLIAVVSILLSTSAFSRDLFVATDGNDSVSYSANSISSPWRTIQHGVYSLKAGDTLNIRGGNYTATTTIVTNNNAASGTANAPVTITGYNGERVVVDLASRNVYMDIQNTHYWTIQNMEFINAGQVAKLCVDRDATHITFRNNKVTMTKGGDNWAAFKFNGSGCEYAVIEGNTIIGPGSGVHGNTGTIYLRKIHNAKILRNHLSNAPIGIYFKHDNDGASASKTDIELAYNVITGMNRNTVQWNGNFGHIHNNIFHDSAAFIFSEANGQSGGDDNVFENNTIYQSSVHLPDNSSGDDTCQGSCRNTIRNNIIWNKMNIHRYKSLPHNSKMDYNFHDTTKTSIAVQNNGTDYSLSGWQSKSGGSANSRSGRLSFVSSSPSRPEDFALPAGSPAKGMGPNGTDPGADVTLVGNGGEIPTPPMPPSALNVLVE